jgi:hypothetical protein
MTATDDLAALLGANISVAGRPVDGALLERAADAILAAGWTPPGTTFAVCGHGRRPDESCILCERVAP